MVISKFSPSAREESFSEKIETSIVNEVSSSENPYVAKEVQWFGYSLEDLIQNCTFTDIIHLLFCGEIPTKEAALSLNATLIALANPGPRHPAVRGAMAAAASKTLVAHWLAIGLNLLSGHENGATEVLKSYQFIKKHMEVAPNETPHPSTQNRAAPGFGHLYGTPEHIPYKSAKKLISFFSDPKAIKWSISFSDHIKENNFSLLNTGLAAAAAIDLNLDKYQAVGIFQISTAIGIFSHAKEISEQSINSLPWVSDENYTILKTQSK